MEITLNVILHPSPAFVELVSAFTGNRAAGTIEETVTDSKKKSNAKDKQPVKDVAVKDLTVEEEFAANKKALEDKAAAIVAEQKEKASAATQEGAPPESDPSYAPVNHDKEMLELRALAKDRMDNSTNGTKEDRAAKIRKYLSEHDTDSIPNLDIQYWVHFRHFLKYDL